MYTQVCPHCCASNKVAERDAVIASLRIDNADLRRQVAELTEALAKSEEHRRDLLAERVTAATRELALEQAALSRDLGAPAEAEWRVTKWASPGDGSWCFVDQGQPIRRKVDAMVKRHAIMFDTLTACQARCTELVEENRSLKHGMRVMDYDWLMAQRDEFMRDLNHEVECARVKHPPCDRKTFLVALAEEVGELAKELLEDGSEERVRAEALQVACVAMRMVLDATDRRQQ
jgi:hypothetical protein